MSLERYTGEDVHAAPLPERGTARRCAYIAQLGAELRHELAQGELASPRAVGMLAGFLLREAHDLDAATGGEITTDVRRLIDGGERR